MRNAGAVAIVGYGPVGAVCAGLFSLRGWNVTVFDAEQDIYPLPRAAHLDHEILRILQELGCADAMVADMRANTGMDFLTADRRVLLSMRSESETASSWPASVFFHQPGFETLLRRRAAELGVTLRLGQAVAGVQSSTAAAVILADGSEHRFDYVIGCDGARSTVRKTLGITSDDLEFEEPWLVVDLVVDDSVDLPELALQVCDPARPHTLVPMPRPRYRFEFMLLEGEDPAMMMDPATVRSLLSSWVDPRAVTIERSAVYTFHGLVADEWRRGRVFLAGDAAHQMPPFLGQGMCSGIRDAANLVWKIDLVHRHDAPPALLDSYQSERSPHVRAIVEAAVGFGRMICTTDADVARERDEALLAAPPPVSTAPSASPALSGALVADGSGRPVAQPFVDGRRLDDVVGARFAVVSRVPVDDAPATRLPLHWLDAESTPPLRDWLDEIGHDVALVRPDRYLLATGDDVREVLQRADAQLFDGNDKEY